MKPSPPQSKSAGPNIKAADPAVDPIDAFRLDGRRAVITGAGSGIGRAAAVLFARMGAHVVVSDIDAARLHETARIAGDAIRVLPLDLAHDGAAQNLAEFAQEFGPIDVWANVAGIGALTPAASVTQAEYRRVTSINMDAAYWCCIAAARAMRPNGRGSILNISSNAADQPIAGLSAYAMTKSALNMLTRSLAAELGPDGIRVNAVAPGFTVTEMTVPDTLDSEARAALIARNANRSPLGLVGEPSDITYAMLYLASDASRFITGQVLRVNGGAAMP